MDNEQKEREESLLKIFFDKDTTEYHRQKALAEYFKGGGETLDLFIKFRKVQAPDKSTETILREQVQDANQLLNAINLSPVHIWLKFQEIVNMQGLIISSLISQGNRIKALEEKQEI